MKRLKKLAEPTMWMHAPTINPYEEKSMKNDYDPNNNIAVDENLKNSVEQLTIVEDNIIQLLKDNGLTGVGEATLRKFKKSLGLNARLIDLKRIIDKCPYDLNDQAIVNLIPVLCDTFGVTTEWFYTKH